MKNLMRIISILVLICGSVIIIGLAFENTLVSGYSVSSFGEFWMKMMTLAVANIIPLICIALCAHCLERNDDNYLTRIIPLYMTIPIVLSCLLTFFDFGESVTDIINKIYTFFQSTYTCLVGVSLLLIIKPNNQITKIIKIAAWGIIILNIVLSIAIQIKSYMVDTLPNVYDYDRYGGFNFTTVSQTESFANKVYYLSLIGEAFIVILLFTTNYGFSSKIEIDPEDIDYGALKKEAEEYNRLEMQKKYSKDGTPEPKEQAQVEDAKGNLLNINNQLGVESNVGKVDEKAKTVKIVGEQQELMPVSNGPVINETLPQQNQDVSKDPPVRQIETPTQVQPPQPVQQVQAPAPAPVQQVQVPKPQIQPPQTNEIVEPNYDQFK